MSEYFAIISLTSGRALSAPMYDNILSEVILLPFGEGDNQFWFWDGTNLRSKKHANKVLDFDFYKWKKYGQGIVQLYDYSNKANQRWKMYDDEFIVLYQNLRLEDLGGTCVRCKKEQPKTTKLGNRSHHEKASCSILNSPHLVIFKIIEIAPWSQSP